LADERRGLDWGGVRFLTRAGHELRTEAACLPLNLWMRGLA
jgi:hypothetical protein